MHLAAPRFGCLIAPPDPSFAAGALLGKGQRKMQKQKGKGREEKKRKERKGTP